MLIVIVADVVVNAFANSIANLVVDSVVNVIADSAANSVDDADDCVEAIAEETRHPIKNAVQIKKQ